MDEKQSDSIKVEVLEAPKRGGLREGAGRPKGSTNKISASDILDAIDDTIGIPFPVQLALNYQKAIYGDDNHLIAKYDQLFLSKVVADRIDITSNGLGFTPPTIVMATKELPDYIDVIPNDKSA